MGRKEKHDHNHVMIDVQDDLSNSIHWKGTKAGTRLKDGSKAGTQICFFSRDTPCNGTNVALVSIWVLWLQNQFIAMLFKVLMSISCGAQVCCRLSSRYLWYQWEGSPCTMSFFNPKKTTALFPFKLVSEVKAWRLLGKPDPRCRELEHLKLILGTAHCEALEQFNKMNRFAASVLSES